MLNRIVLMGRLTRDPELRTTQSGLSVVSYTLACDRDIRSQDGGDQNSNVDFIDVVSWRQQAEFVGKYFKKGQLVCVEGRLQARPWTDKEGNKRTAYEIVTDHAYFAEPKRDGGSGGGYPEVFNQRPSSDSQVPPESKNDFVDVTDDDDGDLPF